MEARARPMSQMLIDWGQGRTEALDELIPIVYEELRLPARRYLQLERVGHALQATALVQQAYLRLVDQEAAGDKQRSRIIELRYFGGLKIGETTAVLKVSPGTVKNKWAMARARLHREPRQRGPKWKLSIGPALRSCFKRLCSDRRASERRSCKKPVTRSRSSWRNWNPCWLRMSRRATS